MVFQTATIEYPTKGIFLLDKPPKPILKLYEEHENEELGPQNAKHRIWMDYDDSHPNTHCENSAWSPEGRLLGFINKENVPMFMIQASTGLMICYIPEDKWQTVQEKWKSRLRKNSLDGGPSKAYKAFNSLFTELKTAFMGAGDDITVLGVQFWTPNSHSTTFNKMLLDVTGQLTRIFPRTVEDFKVGIFFTRQDVLAKLRKGTDYQYNAIWQPPYQPSAPVAYVWIWIMGKQAPGAGDQTSSARRENKSPAAKFDLLRQIDSFHYIIAPSNLGQTSLPESSC